MGNQFRLFGTLHYLDQGGIKFRRLDIVSEFRKYSGERTGLVVASESFDKLCSFQRQQIPSKLGPTQSRHTEGVRNHKHGANKMPAIMKYFLIEKPSKVFALPNQIEGQPLKLTQGTDNAAVRSRD
jgi:hypothetical protein